MLALYSNYLHSSNVLELKDKCPSFEPGSAWYYGRVINRTTEHLTNLHSLVTNSQNVGLCQSLHYATKAGMILQKPGAPFFAFLPSSRALVTAL
jgi:hypothetical protein